MWKGKILEGKYKGNDIFVNNPSKEDIEKFNLKPWKLLEDVKKIMKEN